MLKLFYCSFLTVGTWKVTKVMANGNGYFDYFVYFRLNNIGAELLGYRSSRCKVVSIQSRFDTSLLFRGVNSS